MKIIRSNPLTALGVNKKTRRILARPRPAGLFLKNNQKCDNAEQQRNKVVPTVFPGINWSSFPVFPGLVLASTKTKSLAPNEPVNPEIEFDDFFRSPSKLSRVLFPKYARRFQGNIEDIAEEQRHTRQKQQAPLPVRKG